MSQVNLPPQPAISTPILVNPSGRTDGWTQVMTGTVSNMPLITFNPSLIARAKQIVMRFELNITSGDSHQLQINGGPTNLNSTCTFRTAGGATAGSSLQTFGQVSTVDGGSTRVFIDAVMTIPTGQWRTVTSRFYSYVPGTSRIETVGEGFITYRDDTTAITTLQFCAVGAPNNILAGSRSRISYE